MAGNKIFNSNLEILGGIKVSSVSNSTGTFVTWNATTNSLGTRTHAQLLEDLGLNYVLSNKANINGNNTTGGNWNIDGIYSTLMGTSNTNVLSTNTNLLLIGNNQIPNTWIYGTNANSVGISTPTGYGHFWNSLHFNQTNVDDWIALSTSNNKKKIYKNLASTIPYSTTGKIKLRLGTQVFKGLVKIHVKGDYAGGNANGYIELEGGIGANPGAIWNSTVQCTNAIGNTPEHFYVNPTLQTDSTGLYFEIYKIHASSNSIYVDIELSSNDANINTFVPVLADWDDTATTSLKNESIYKNTDLFANKANINGDNTVGGTWKIGRIENPDLTISNKQLLHSGGSAIYFGNTSLDTMVIESGNVNLKHGRAGGQFDIWTSYHFNSAKIANWDTAYGWGNHVGKYIGKELNPGISNGSNTRPNMVWFDYDWAGSSMLGSVINFSGLAEGYNTEIFGKYTSNELFFRTRNGDSSSWNPVRKIWTDGDFSLDSYIKTQHLYYRIIYDADTAVNKGVDFYYLVGINKPTGYTDGALLSMAYDSSWVSQLTADWRTNKWFVRSKEMGVWKPWVALATEEWVGSQGYLTSLPTHTHTWSQVTSTPTTIDGYGITDAVPSSRTLTINGTTYDLSANRAWTIPTHDALTLGTSQNGLSLAGQVLSLGLSSTSTTGSLSSTDWNTFNNKQTALNGTGVLSFNGTTPSYTAGTAGQLLRRNAANTGYEFFSPPYAITVNGNAVTGSDGNIKDEQWGVDLQSFVYPMPPENVTSNPKGFNTKGGYATKYQIITDTDTSVEDNVEVITRVGGSTNSVRLDLPDPNNHPERILRISNNSVVGVAGDGILLLYGYDVTSGGALITELNPANLVSARIFPFPDNVSWVTIMSMDIEGTGDYQWMAIESNLMI